MTETTIHVPVLLAEVLRFLDPQPGETVLDATAGGGGHSSVLCTEVGERGRVIALDRDPDAAERVRARLSGGPCSALVINSSFSRCADVMRAHDITAVHRALFDLGFSSDQLKASGRGFALRKENEPLDMRFDPAASDITAAHILHTFTEAELANVIFAYGEERFARRIAAAIVNARADQPVRTVGGLVALIQEGIPKRFQHGRLHFATKTFQALRIAVNDELSELEEGLSGAFEILKPGGRIAVISFHGLEDKIVKTFFRERARDMSGILLTKKPVVSDAREREENPRARSAKLRVLEKQTI